MGLSKSSANGRARPAMNVTPLVDIVLVLLIIFMVVLPNTETGATVQPPTIDHGEPDPEGPDPILLVLQDNGQLELDGVGRLPLEQLQSELDRVHAGEPDRSLMLRADREVPYLQVRGVFKLAQDIGFPGVMLRVNARPEDEQEG